MNNWISAHDRMPTVYGKYFIKFGDGINGMQNLYKDVVSLQELIYTTTRYEIVLWLDDQSDKSKSAIACDIQKLNRIKTCSIEKYEPPDPITRRRYNKGFLENAEFATPRKRGRPRKYE